MNRPTHLRGVSSQSIHGRVHSSGIPLLQQMFSGTPGERSLGCVLSVVGVQTGPQGQLDTVFK